MANDDRRLILDLQMKLQTKGALVDSYAAEIERLQREGEGNGVGAGQGNFFEGAVVKGCR